MSLFSWLFPAPSKRAPKSLPDSSGLSRMEATRPVGRSGSGGGSNGAASSNGSNGQPANRKNERMARRELLYQVVRDSMMRAGVLSSSYKFKVLSLDARGRQFLVMCDLARDYGGETSRLAEIEAMIAQAAKTRHDILVTAVYWRMNEHVAVGEPVAVVGRKTEPAVVESTPIPLDSSPAVLESAPALLAAHPDPGPAAVRGPSRYDPIQSDEVEAFRRALASGATSAAAVAASAAAAKASAASTAIGEAPLAPELRDPAQAHGASAKAFDGSTRHGPQSYTLLTGFEDTEMPETKGPALSGTQYGELR
ncbi:MAG: hypothetical protein V4669_05930 [Pseudomonadota bacterium]